MIFPVFQHGITSGQKKRNYLKICAPPMTKIRSICGDASGSDNLSSAESKLEHFVTEAGQYSGLERYSFVRTTFNLWGSGRNLDGRDSQVFLPIITAFIFSFDSVAVVNSLKKAMSAGNFQGSFPLNPMPSSLVAATMI